MKYLILFFIILLSSSSFSQTQITPKPFSIFNLEILGGVNYTNSSGPSFIIEGRTNLTGHLDLKFSIGYIVVNNKDFRKVKTYRHFVIPGYPDIYQTEDYNINYTQYRIAPISISIEYALNKYGRFTPYSFIEGGYNAYDAKFEISNIISPAEYKSYDDIPADYRHELPAVPGGGSFRIGLGIGTRYNLFRNIDLDIRYLYQVNSNIVNMHQILIGFLF